MNIAGKNKCLGLALGAVLVLWLGTSIFLYSYYWGGLGKLLAFYALCLPAAWLLWPKVAPRLEAVELTAAWPVLPAGFAACCLLAGEAAYLGQGGAFAGRFLFEQSCLFLNAAGFFGVQLLFALICLIIGQKALERSGLLVEDRLAHGLVSIAAGAGLIMLFVFCLALLGWLYAWVLAVALLAFLVLNRRFVRESLRRLWRQPVRLSGRGFGKYKLLISGLLALFLSVIFIAVAKPLPKDADSQNAYFNAPKIYAEEHRYVALRYHPHASMGQNAEMIYAAFLSFLPSDYIAHLSWLALILVLLAAFSLGRLVAGEQPAWLGLLAVFLVPINSYFAYAAKTDLWLCFYLLAAAYAAVYALKSGRYGFLLLAGFFGGVAAGVKYTALIFLAAFFISGLLMNFFSFRVPWKKLSPYLIGAVFAALASFSPWAAKNIYYFGKPLHPLGIGALPRAESAPADADYALARNREVSELKFDFRPGERNPAKAAASILSQSIGRNIYRTEGHNLGIAFLLLPCLFLAGRGNRYYRLLFLSLLLYLLLWYGLGNGGIWHAYIAALLAYLLLGAVFGRYPLLAWLYLPFALGAFAANLGFYDTTPYLARQETRAATIRRQAPNHEIALCYNALAGPDDRLAVVGEFRAAFFKNGHENIAYVDPYFARTGALMRLGGDRFKSYLDDNGVRYLFTSSLYRIYESWPENKGLSLESYKAAYSRPAESLYDDIDLFHDFLRNNAVLSCGNDYYSLYKVR